MFRRIFDASERNTNWLHAKRRALRRCLADLTTILGQRWWDSAWDTVSLPIILSAVLLELLFFLARKHGVLCHKHLADLAASPPEDYSRQEY